MKQSQIILVGGGGHCKSCIDVIELENKYKIAGIIDLPALLGQKILGYEIIANDDDIANLAKKGHNFLITLGYMGGSSRRNELYKLIKRNGGELPSIISPFAHVSTHAKIGEGTIIMHNCILNTDAIIGNNCIINTKALIEHDTIVGNNCHISTDVNLNGNCKVDNNIFIGSAATIKNGVTICSNTVIGAGSLILKSILNEGQYYGNPVKMSSDEG